MAEIQHNTYESRDILHSGKGSLFSMKESKPLQQSVSSYEEKYAAHSVVFLGMEILSTGKIKWVFKLQYRNTKVI